MDDLKLIKKHYGEKMMHLCRELFPTILETEGLLYKTLTSKFYPSRNIYDELIKDEEKIEIFKNIIYNAIVDEKKESTALEKTPFELLDEAGYTLYECKSEADIQSFRHYYQRRDGKATPKYVEGERPEHNNGEELCTFSGGRLDRCYVFFAVKKNVLEIKRKENPERQDEYGTSVISIQFAKGDTNTLSIKNRYNHTVKNPDATFSNDLDSIIEGLTKSFENEYGLNINSTREKEYLPGFVKADDGKYYRYNFERDNVYYCDDNIIIDNFEAKHFDKSRYLIFENYIIDFQEKSIWSYCHNGALYKDSFTESLGNIKSIKVENDKDTKEKRIIINDDIIIVLTKTNQIKSYKNSHITRVSPIFLKNSTEIESIDLENVERIGEDFLANAIKLNSINIPNCKRIDNGFLRSNKKLKEIDLPNVKTIKDNFMFANEALERINVPKLETFGHRFLYSNIGLEEISLPEITKISSGFLSTNKKIKKIYIPNCIKIGDNFLEHNECLEEIDLPSVEEIGDNFMLSNKKLKRINLDECEFIGDQFLTHNLFLESISLPKVISIGDKFLYLNSCLSKISLPRVVEIYSSFLEFNLQLEEIDLPNVIDIDSRFLFNNNKLKRINMPRCKTIGSFFLRENETLESIDLPCLEGVGAHFLFRNKILKRIFAPKVIKVEEDFLVNNEELEEIDLPNVKKIERSFLSKNSKIKKVNISSVESIDIGFLEKAQKIKEIFVPKLKFLFGNRLEFTRINLPFKLITNKNELSEMFEEDSDNSEKGSGSKNK